MPLSASIMETISFYSEGCYSSAAVSLRLTPSLDSKAARTEDPFFLSGSSAQGGTKKQQKRFWPSTWNFRIFADRLERVLWCFDRPWRIHRLHARFIRSLHAQLGWPCGRSSKRLGDMMFDRNGK